MSALPTVTQSGHEPELESRSQGGGSSYYDQGTRPRDAVALVCTLQAGSDLNSGMWLFATLNARGYEATPLVSENLLDVATCFSASLVTIPVLVHNEVSNLLCLAVRLQV